MIMPFVRLFAIYLVVGLAVFAFFKRDALMAMIDGSEAEVAMAAEPTVAPVLEPVAESIIAQPTPEPQPTPTRVAEPVFVSAETTIPQPTEPQDMDARLSEARQAYWGGDVVTAEFLYKNLSADFPTEMNIKGELGNLYFNSGRMSEAAEQFYTVGLFSLRLGNTTQTKAMIGVLQSTAPAMAVDLIARADQLN